MLRFLASEAAEEGKFWDQCFHYTMAVLDLSPWAALKVADKAVDSLSVAAKMVRARKKGVSLRKLLQASKSLAENAPKLEKLNDQMRFLVPMVYRLCMRAQGELEKEGKDGAKS